MSIKVLRLCPAIENWVIGENPNAIKCDPPNGLPRHATFWDYGSLRFGAIHAMASHR